MAGLTLAESSSSAGQEGKERERECNGEREPGERRERRRWSAQNPNSLPSVQPYNREQNSRLGDAENLSHADIVV